GTGIFVVVSVARREWKSEAELRAWITQGARVTAFSREWEHVPALEILHQPPRSGRANWRVIDHQGGSGSGGWSITMRSVIARALLQFQLRAASEPVLPSFPAHLLRFATRLLAAIRRWFGAHPWRRDRAIG